ncbi:helix-turn-helix transcriptional regulator [Desulfobulbus rhabdoformis]|jgi:ArsR family transcriptional regulator|uniref:ArsR/SmtB family transcription factor n=1 Tax=Desulfobulbus rhabdoformis TaxID=34032 RepID=UPI001964AEE0|nr:metalloregulator ArsR/SmtB family transcription factor [Desulfobulbus rhabdoformis]MBM9613434.1 helix-turn-helix transcriptional regulator [Desulfobulbus rhabdoformis]
MDKNDIYTIAALLKAIAHPIRLEILCCLRKGEHSVTELQRTIQTTDGNLSQHLSVLRNQGIISSRKEANFIYNKINDKHIVALMNSLQKIYCPTR